MIKVLKTVRGFGATAKAWLPDFLMVGGVGAMSYGAWMVYEPAGAIVAGVFMLIAGILLARGAE